VNEEVIAKTILDSLEQPQGKSALNLQHVLEVAEKTVINGSPGLAQKYGLKLSMISLLSGINANDATFSPVRQAAERLSKLLTDEAFRNKERQGSAFKYSGKNTQTLDHTNLAPTAITQDESILGLFGIKNGGASTFTSVKQGDTPRKKASYDEQTSSNQLGVSSPPKRHSFNFNSKPEVNSPLTESLGTTPLMKKKKKKMEGDKPSELAQDSTIPATSTFTLYQKVQGSHVDNSKDQNDLLLESEQFKPILTNKDSGKVNINNSPQGIDDDFGEFKETNSPGKQQESSAAQMLK